MKDKGEAETSLRRWVGVSAGTWREGRATGTDVGEGDGEGKSVVSFVVARLLKPLETDQPASGTPSKVINSGDAGLPARRAGPPFPSTDPSRVAEDICTGTGT